jgi:hypothetical protein
MKNRHCCTPSKEASIPLRSTVCFVNTNTPFISNAEYIRLQDQWKKFEEVETHDAEVYNRLINELPVAVTESPWYQFANNNERQDYLSGQRNHIIEFPSVSSFQIPYSKKKLEYVSSVLQQISTLNSAGYPKPIKPAICNCDTAIIPQKPSEQIIKDRAGLNLYVRVSTQSFLYPKSPYRFTNNEEYLSYKFFDMMINKK